jgi:hypothetical protein
MSSASSAANRRSNLRDRDDENQPPPGAAVDPLLPAWSYRLNMP